MSEPARNRRVSALTEDTEVARLVRELAEAREQQSATSEILEVISRSAFDLKVVFETVAESSVRLCGANRAFIYRFDGELLRLAAAFNAPQKLQEWLEQKPIRAGRQGAAARAALEGRTIHIPDVLADPEYSWGVKDVEAIRTVLAVPILKGDELLGVMIIYRLEEAGLSPTIRSLSLRPSPIRQPSPSRTLGCSTNCVNPCNDRPPPPTCSR